MIVPCANAASGESNIIWTGDRADLEACCDFLFGDGEPCAVPFNPETGCLIVNGAEVRPGDMIHKGADGAIRVLVPANATLG